GTNASPAGGTWSGRNIINPATGLYDPSHVPGLVTDIVVYTVISQGCVFRDTLVVSLNVPTGAAFNIPACACLNTSTNFSDTIANTTATWDFGDGSGSISGNNVSHTYHSTGNFVITLTIQNAGGCSGSVQRNIHVISAPNVSFTLSDKSICAGIPDSIFNTSVFDTSAIYVWDYGDGTIDTTISPSPHFYVQGLADTTYHIT